mmetsp:Transcript_169156/g.543745  ORF Transcript_169156/g.543745 Transcript_169156/m.543745 type:complete len:524 (+) Transcript_169156:150-1721(+)
MSGLRWAQAHHIMAPMPHIPRSFTTSRSSHHATHATHAAHAAAGRTTGRGKSGPREVRHDHICGEQHASDRGSIDQGVGNHLGRVHNAGGDEVLEGLRGSVVTEAHRLPANLIQDLAGVLPRIQGDLPHGRRQRLENDLGTLFLVLCDQALGDCVDVHLLLEMEEDAATARHDALLPRTPDCLQSIIVTQFFVVHLCLRRSSDLDLRYATAECRDAVGELFLVVTAVCVVHLAIQLLDAHLHLLRLGAVADDDRPLLFDDDTLAGSQLLHGGIGQGHAELRVDEHSTGGDCNVLQDGGFPVAEGRRLDGDDVQDAALLVEDKRLQRLAGDVVGDDENRLLGLKQLLQQVDDVVHIRQLLVSHQDPGFFQLGNESLSICDEIGRNVAAIDGHALGELDLIDQDLRLLDHDIAGVADSLPRLGDVRAHFRVAAGADRGDVEKVASLYGCGDPLDLGRDEGRSGLHTLQHQYRVEASHHSLHAILDHCLGQDSGSGGAVASVGLGLCGRLGEQLHAEIHLLIRQRD